MFFRNLDSSVYHKILQPQANATRDLPKPDKNGAFRGSEDTPKSLCFKIPLEYIKNEVKTSQSGVELNNPESSSLSFATSVIVNKQPREK